MKATLVRKYNELETQGALYVYEGIDYIFCCKTLELPYKGNQHNISCIPEGAYDVVKITSTKEGNCFQILNVPGREGILIHKGNYATGSQVDTEGCILVGMSFADINTDGQLDVKDSTIALNKLLNILPDSFRLHII
jgi:hypothetical protein